MRAVLTGILIAAVSPTTARAQATPGEGSDAATGFPDRRWPHLDRAVHPAREFGVPVLFPMHFRDQTMCESFVTELAAEGVTAEVTCPTVRGQRFVAGKGGRSVNLASRWPVGLLAPGGQDTLGEI